MSRTAPPLLENAPLSRYDRWAMRVRADAALQRRISWLAPLLVTLLAAVLRFWNLQNPHAIVFDETYYVKDAWSQWNLGYPANWPANANGAFEQGVTDDYETSGSFVVHPPLGKWIIGLGMWIFGPASSFGWRFSVALLGTATVLLVYLVTKALTRSVAAATIASLLMAIDGLAIVMSRVALLDGILTFFVILAFWFVLLDRAWCDRRLGARDPDRPSAWGRLLWNRPWLLAAGAAAGAATAVKWSGLYVIAALGVYVVISDAVARWRLGIRMWHLDAVRQGLWSAVLMLPVALVVYVVSWTGWLVTAGGYDRQYSGAPPEGLAALLPQPLQNLWVYHGAMYGFNVNLHTPHSYQSPAWEWPLLIRPTSMYWEQGANGVQAISSIPNPLIWWAGIAAAIYLLVRFVRRPDAAAGFVLVGIIATYVPWLLYPDRTIFQFYTIVMLPFLVIAVALAARDIAGGPDASPARRRSGQGVVLVFLGVAVVLSAFWYPVWTAMPVPYDFWRLHNWMQSWI
ncbi:phospholipid carrier-dependent glycosyltransferase [uncultured Microbacterium sp.]|nr:phospholipid carrier-dependent glycosyltransferase [uncultured Microbacterium sp.]